MLTHALTFDVEDFYQVSAFEKWIDRRDWERFPQRVVSSTRRLLQLLGEANVKATFFVLGWTAEHYPQLVREIHAQGHEIGSHSYWHRLIYQQTPAEFRADLQRSRDVLEEILGIPVTSFRAPSFSIIPSSRWALDILASEGFTVDSSLFPVRHDRYGMPDAEPHPNWLETAHGKLREFPLTALNFGNYALPIAGGGYFRLYPYAATRWFLNRFAATTGKPFVFYLHPWEIDPQQPRLSFGSSVTRWRHCVNLSRTEARLVQLLKDFCFAPLTTVLDQTLPAMPVCPVQETMLHV